MQVYPSSAPNVFGSPSWPGYLSNAMNSLHNGLGNIGNRATDPTAYEIAGPFVTPGDFIVTSFNSWRGEAFPAAPFNAEFGNRMHFGLHIMGDGTSQVRLQDLTFHMHSSDPADSLHFAGNFAGLHYTGTTRFGVDWGPDRIRGTTDDIVYNSGNGATLVDEIVYVGVGNAYWPPSVAGIQDTIDYVLANAPFTFSTTYGIVDQFGRQYRGSASVMVLPIPEPASVAVWRILGGGLVSREWFVTRAGAAV